MKAFVKKGNLPGAPAPTLPVRGFEAWEIRHYKELAKGSGDFAPKNHGKWSDDETQALINLWEEGKSPNQIAKVLKRSAKSTSNKVGYMISLGKIQKKRCQLPREEVEQILEAYRNGADIPSLCREHRTGERYITIICKQK